MANRYRYDPFGNTLSEGTAEQVSNPFKYGGEFYDSELTLYKQGMRFYDPRLGRWTQKDPLDQVTEPRQSNRYAFAGQDAVTLTDPSGLDWYEADIGPVSVGWDDEIDALSVGAEANYGVPIGFSAGKSTGVAQQGLSLELEGCFFGCVGASSDTGLQGGLGFNWSADAGVEATYDF